MQACICAPFSPETLQAVAVKGLIYNHSGGHMPVCVGILQVDASISMHATITVSDWVFNALGVSKSACVTSLAGVNNAL